jgi:hypothetical protein
MNKKILGSVVVGFLMTAPLAATAQVTTLFYQGDFMTGTSTYLPVGLTAPGNGVFATLPTAPVLGAFTVSLTVDGSISANDLTLVSTAFNFNGSNGVANFSPSIELDAQVITFGGVDFSVPGGDIILTSSNGAITGATVDLRNTPFREPSSLIDIGPTGDSFTYGYGGGLGGCQDLVLSGPNPVPYAGPAINPCSVSASNATPGAWLVTTQAPEIDTRSAASGLTLLLGGLAVMRGRRTKQPRCAA